MKIMAETIIIKTTAVICAKNAIKIIMSGRFAWIPNPFVKFVFLTKYETIFFGFSFDPFSMYIDHSRTDKIFNG